MFCAQEKTPFAKNIARMLQNVATLHPSDISCYKKEITQKSQNSK